MLKIERAATAIQTNLAAVFVSMELSRSTWLITALLPGNGERMSKYSVAAAGYNFSLLLNWFRQLLCLLGAMLRAFRPQRQAISISSPY